MVVVVAVVDVIADVDASTGVVDHSGRDVSCFHVQVIHPSMQEFDHVGPRSTPQLRRCESNRKQPQNLSLEILLPLHAKRPRQSRRLVRP